MCVCVCAPAWVGGVKANHLFLCGFLPNFEICTSFLYPKVNETVIFFQYFKMAI